MYRSRALENFVFICRHSIWCIRVFFLQRYVLRFHTAAGENNLLLLFSIANLAPTVADVSMSLNTLRYVTPLKIGQTNLEKVKINPDNPANWDNDKLRNFVQEKTKGSIDPELFCPFESGMQILRIPEAVSWKEF